MINLNSNKGVTLAILIVVIITVIILLGISINMGVDSIDESVDEQFKSELYIVQQAIYQKSIENESIGDSAEIVGTVISDISKYKEFENAYKKINEKEIDIINTTYYVLKKEDLEKLGLSGKRVSESEFIVNYITGEVYNNAKNYYTDDITPMYLPGYNIDSKTGKNKSDILEIGQ